MDYKNYSLSTFCVLLSTYISTTVIASVVNKETPKVTIILVVDQLPYWQFQRLSPYFKSGFKTLITKGIDYTNAIHPHARPGTAAGHNGLQTGTYPKEHGIVNNSWITPEGTKVNSDDDLSPTAAVLNPRNGAYDTHLVKGKSAQYIMANGVSDQFMLANTLEEPHHVFSVSLKGRSAIACASKLGKAIWYDNHSGLFTSSKAYFCQLPAWLTFFNDTNWILHKKEITWNLAHPQNYAAYQFHNPRTYQFVETGRGLVGRKMNANKPLKYKHDKDKILLLTPFANQLILDLALDCLKQYVSKTKPDRLLLWVCIGATDKLGHKYGTDSRESIDMLYHLDQQIGAFIKKVHKYLPDDDVLYVLTSDHGGSPLPELMKERGFMNARRILTSQLLAELNNAITEQFPELQNLAIGIKVPSLYLDEKILKTLPACKQEEILTLVKEYLHKVPGIKRVWTFQELVNAPIKADEIENYFKNFLYKDRSGQIQIQLEPYTLLNEYTTGSEHQTPYHYDTHVPLIFYRPGVYEHQIITQSVFTQQVANTLAQILGVVKPSASTFPVLPPFGGVPECVMPTVITAP